MLDMDREKKVQEAVLTAIKEGLVNSAHDCSEGGLAIALAECCVTGPGPHHGAQITLSTKMRADAVLFGESQSRVVVSLADKHLSAFKRIVNEIGVPVTFLGIVGGDGLTVDLPDRHIDSSIDEMRKLYWGTLRPLMTV